MNQNNIELEREPEAMSPEETQGSGKVTMFILKTFNLLKVYSFFSINPTIYRGKLIFQLGVLE